MDKTISRRAVLGGAVGIAVVATIPDTSWAAAFVEGVSEPTYWREGGAHPQAGPFAPRLVSSTDPNIAGVKPGLARSNYSGSINWNTPQVLRNINLNLSNYGGRLVIPASNPLNHTLDNVLVTGGSLITSSTGGGYVNTERSAGRTTLRHVTLCPSNPNRWLTGVYGSHFDAYRCLIEHTVDIFGVANRYRNATDYSIRHTWGGNLAWAADDAPAHNDGSGTHNDWLQVHSGDGRNSLIEACTIWGYKWNLLNWANQSTTGNGDVLAYNLGNGSWKWPQIGCGILFQTNAYFNTYPAVMRNLYVYGTEVFLRPVLNTRDGSAPAIDVKLTGTKLMNDDQRVLATTSDPEKRLIVRVDNKPNITINGQATSGLVRNQRYTVNNGNNVFSSSSSTDRKYNVAPSRRGTKIWMYWA